MLRAAVPRTCDLCAAVVTCVRRSGLTSRVTPRRPDPSPCGGAFARAFTCSGVSWGEDRFAQDPEVKRWMRELHEDFSRNQKGEEKESIAEEEVKERKGSTKRGEEEEVNKERKGNTKQAWEQFVAEKYQKLENQSQIIYDYDEERLRKEAGMVEEKAKKEKIKLERGVTGVFDIEELVELLKEDNAQDIVVIQIPLEIRFVEYMVIVSSHSNRHTTALAELVKGAYKLKKQKKDPSVILEGKSTDWVAVDMGNIALHIMRPETRETYDLETLWTVGPEYDERSQNPEEDLLGEYIAQDPTLALPDTPSLTHQHRGTDLRT